MATTDISVWPSLPYERLGPDFFKNVQPGTSDTATSTAFSPEQKRRLAEVLVKSVETLGEVVGQRGETTKEKLRRDIPPIATSTPTQTAIPADSRAASFIQSIQGKNVVLIVAGFVLLIIMFRGGK